MDNAFDKGQIIEVTEYKGSSLGIVIGDIVIDHYSKIHTQLVYWFYVFDHDSPYWKSRFHDCGVAYIKKIQENET